MKYKNPVIRVAAIHDLSGYGRVSLNSVIPILTNMGMQVCPLPTAILSSHTQYPDFRFVDLTDYMESFISHWKELKLNFDGIYSGYLASPAQIGVVEQFICDFRTLETLVVVDPVLGDNGKLYKNFDKDMIVQMKRLILSADLITPNLTELAFLVDKPLKKIQDTESIKEAILSLSHLGPEMVVVTSVKEDSESNPTSVIAYNRANNRFWKVSCSYMPASYPGTGDCFTSVLTGSLLQGDSLPIALDRAVQFVSIGVRATFGYDHDPREGILLEKVLHNLDAPVQSSSYEIL